MPEEFSLSDKHLIAGLVALAITAWLLSGALGGSPLDAAEGGLSSAAQEAPLVRAVESQANVRELFLEVRAQTRAKRAVQVRSEVTGVIESLPVEKGGYVKAGDLLCKVAIDTRAADLEEARADLRSAQLEYDGVLDLQKRGLQSEINVAKTRAALESSRAKTKRAELALKKTSILAPFDGVVDDRAVEIGDYLTVGQVCATLIEVNPVLVVGQVSERNIGQVALGNEVTVGLITGENLTGLVTFIGRTPDAATRTYPIEVTIENPGENIRAGLTAQMKVPVGEKRAHLISPASLVLNDEGTMGVRIVDDSSKVRFMPIQIVSESPLGMWVDGLPERVRLITVGQEEVFDGQAVRIDLTPLGSIVKSS